MSSKEEKRCCICGELFSEYGNNPDPLGSIEDKCCDDCNSRFVVPVRLISGRTCRDDVKRFLCVIAQHGKMITRANRMARAALKT